MARISIRYTIDIVYFRGIQTFKLSYGYNMANTGDNNAVTLVALCVSLSLS